MGQPKTPGRSDPANPDGLSHASLRVAGFDGPADLLPESAYAEIWAALEAEVESQARKSVQAS